MLKILHFRCIKQENKSNILLTSPWIQLAVMKNYENQYLLEVRSMQERNGTEIPPSPS